MLVVIAITVLEDDGTEVDAAQASGETVDEAFELARMQLDIAP
jgi:hypothetical protein